MTPSKKMHKNTVALLDELRARTKCDPEDAQEAIRAALKTAKALEDQVNHLLELQMESQLDETTDMANFHGEMYHLLLGFKETLHGLNGQWRRVMTFEQNLSTLNERMKAHAEVL